MVALIGLIIIAIPVTAFWIYTETPSGKEVDKESVIYDTVRWCDFYNCC